MLDLLQQLLRDEWLEPIDAHLAMTLGRVGNETDPQVLLALALVSRQVRMGDTCLLIDDAELQKVLRDDEDQPFSVKLMPAAAWRKLLAASPLVSSSAAADRPLVLDDDGRLYLNRYWQHERSIAAQLKMRARFVDNPPDAAWLRQALKRVFPASKQAADLQLERPLDGELDWQRVATVMALLRHFAVISGGPGTGKTFTVTKILTLLVEDARHRGQRPPRIVLLAPTGKAAARLGESIKRAKLELAVDDAVKAAIPDEGMTIHRALGSIAGSSTRFRHNSDNPLAADLVLVDEASMVDIGLMARLIAAVPRRARLVLLGDQDQLASVEAGAVLGDICNTGQKRAYSQDLLNKILQISGDDLSQVDAELLGPPRGETGIWDSIAVLQHSYRFDDQGGIGALAKAIKKGDADQVLALLTDEKHKEVHVQAALPDGALTAAFKKQVYAHYKPYLLESKAENAINAFQDFRVLYALRRGISGALHANRLLEAYFAEQGLIEARRRFYRGRPVMVTRNDYVQKLFNGDIGITLPDADDPRAERVCFIAPDGSLRSYAPSWLPQHETVYAMTVHKSQGSEFDHVALVLPRKPSPILTRELIYTAVTRAKSALTIYAEAKILSYAIERRLYRQSGLRKRLWGDKS